MKKTGRLPFLVVLAAALAAGAAAAGISTFLMKRIISAQPSKPQKVEIVPLTFMYPLGEQIVNLAEPGRFLKVGIELEILAKGSTSEVNAKALEGEKGHEEGTKTEKPLPPPAAATKAELEEKRAKILDSVIEELSISSFRQLLTPKGKRDLRERIKRAINNLIESGEVQNVYFTTFLAQ